MGIQFGFGRSAALRIAVVVGACLIALLVFSAGSAWAAYTARVQSGTLALRGDAASDKLALRIDPNDPSTLQVDVGEDGTADFSFPLSSFTAIGVAAGAGNDEVRIDQSFGSFADKAVTINGGDGNDRLLGGDGSDHLTGGTGDDIVDGGRGNDVVQMDDGADTFTWDPGDGSDTVDGGTGTQDTLDFNGSNASEHYDISANGSRVRFFRDVADITMDLHGIDRVDLETLGGSDNVTVNDLSGTDLRSVNVDLAGLPGGTGDSQPDTVTDNATNHNDHVQVNRSGASVLVTGLYAKLAVSGSDAASDVVNVATLDGDDTLTSNVGVSGPAAIGFDGGSGTDTATYFGDAHPNTIGIASDGTAVSTFVSGKTASPLHSSNAENLIVDGLGAFDTITGENGLAALTKLTIDGGDGNDRLIGGDGDDVLIGGTGDDKVSGGRGNDLALLGDGNDTFIWDPGEGSDTVEGQAGQNVLDFHGSNVSENIDVSANGSRVRLFRDVGNVVMDMSGIQTANVEALGGADRITADDLTGTALRAVNVDLASPPGSRTGDAQPDTVTAGGTGAADHVHVSRSGSRIVVSGLYAQLQVTGQEPANDIVNVAGLGGDDTLTTGIAVPQATVGFDGGEGSDTAAYTGTASADTIGIASDGTAVSTFTSAKSSILKTTAVENLKVNGEAGNDTIAGGNGLAALTHLTISGDDGNDRLIGGDGDDTLLGGSGDDSVAGARGSDLALLGDGNDTFTWNPGDGSDTVDGQVGTQDAVDFNGANVSENIDVSANGNRVRLFRDVGNVTMDMHGFERLNLEAMGAADHLTVNDLSGTDLRSTAIDLAAPPGGGGDGQPDTVTVNGSPHADHVNVGASAGKVMVTGLYDQLQIGGSEPANDTLQLNTLGGLDTAVVSPGVSGLINPVVDLGADQ